MSFGKLIGGKGMLNVKDELCCICQENKRCVELPKCTHFLCIKCFKRLYWPNQLKKLTPRFPYDKETEDEYNENPDAEKWKDDFPIKAYNIMLNTYLDLEDEYQSRESASAKCPLCRA
jgi:hypothetical protein